MPQLRYVGRAPTVLASGQPVAPGAIVESDLSDPHDELLAKEGLLIEAISEPDPDEPTGEQPAGDGEASNAAPDQTTTTSRRRQNKETAS